MKSLKEVLILISILIILSSISIAQECLPPGELCPPIECGCGVRVAPTLDIDTDCPKCGEYGPCYYEGTAEIVPPEFINEIYCDNDFDDDCDDLIDCDDPDCAEQDVCKKEIPPQPEPPVPEPTLPEPELPEIEKKPEPKVEPPVPVAEEPTPPEPVAEIPEPEPPKPELPEEIKKPTITAPVCIDNDKDGYGENCPKGLDCDDTNMRINPGMQEICNNIDENCNGYIDENLIKYCGTNIGICQQGYQKCEYGEWSECVDDVRPRPEVCYNNMDDDCNKIVDDDCPELSADENSVAIILRKDIGMDADITDLLRKCKLTKPYVNIQKEYKIKDRKTFQKLKIIPIQTLKGVTVYEFISKKTAEHINQIKFKTLPDKIVEEDPLTAWYFTQVDEKTDLSYEIEGEKVPETRTVVIADEIEPKKQPAYIKLLPLLLIPIILFAIIYFARFAKKKD